MKKKCEKQSGKKSVNNVSVHASVLSFSREISLIKVYFVDY